MNPKILLRIAAGCMLFFAVGHTIGHTRRYDRKEANVKEVIEQMKAVKYDMFGQMRSYDDNLTGMSLNLIFTLLAFTLILWLISTTNDKKLAIKLLIPITICVIGFAVTSFLYFFLVPAVTCVVPGLLMTISIIQLNK